MDYALIDTIARLTNTRPNWDREVTRAVGAARACAIAALIRALGAEVEYADLRGIELSQARPEVPDRPLNATNPVVRDLPSVKRIYDQEGHAIAHRDDDRDRRPGARLGQRRRLHRRGRPAAERRVVRRLPGGLATTLAIPRGAGPASALAARAKRLAGHPHLLRGLARGRGRFCHPEGRPPG